MANETSIDTSSLSAVITEFRRMHVKDSITPEGLGSILQRIADLLATAGTSQQADQIKALSPLLTAFGTITMEEIDSPSELDTFFGRLLQVKSEDSSPFTDGWLMYLTCTLYTTQILFTHCLIDDNGSLITSTHDEKAFHIYKRWRHRTNANVNWSPWAPISVGANADADMAATLNQILGRSEDIVPLKARAQIAVEIVDGCLRVYGSKVLAEAGYVPYLFRHTRRRNRYRKPGSTRKWGPVTKGWHMFGSRHTVIVEDTVAMFSTNEHSQLHKVAESYSTDPTNLVQVHESEDGVTVAWGKNCVSMIDSNHGTWRMLRLPFAIGYAKPIEPGSSKINQLNLVSNLAQFSVIYDPRTNDFVLSR